MNLAQSKAKADVLKALGHPLRVQMLEALARGDRCVNDLRALATVSQPTVSRHLAWLKRVGLVTERRVGPRVLHHLACPGMLQALKCAEESAAAVRKAPRRRLSPYPFPRLSRRTRRKVQKKPAPIGAGRGERRNRLTSPC